MPKFHYSAINAKGKPVEGNAKSGSTEELLQELSRKGLTPTSVKAFKGKEGFIKSKESSVRRIKLIDQIFLTKYIGIMLRVGTDLFQAINILIADLKKKPSLRNLLMEVRDALESGQPFYSTFAKYPKYFSKVFINLIKAGEASGTLEQVFDGLYITLTQEKELRSKIKGALLYPIILIVLSFLILMFLMTFALPRLAAVFSGNGFDPPAFSRAVFAVGLFVESNLIAILILFGLIVAGVIFLTKSHAGAKLFSRLRVKIPVIRVIAKQLAIQRFASTLASLLRAGLPIIESIEITADAVNHPELEIALTRIKENVSKGVSLGDAFRKEDAFPLVVTNLVAISEKAGKLDEVLDSINQFYNMEINTALKRAVSLIEPILLPIIGIIIGTIALAIIVPVYQLVGQI